MKKSLIITALGSLVIAMPLMAAEPDLSKLPPASTRKDVTYASDIKPLFEASCIRCHGQEEHKAKLRLDSLEATLKGSEDGKIITPGSSEKSRLVIAVAQLDPETAMPPQKRGRGKGPQGQGQRPRPTEVAGSTNAPASWEHKTSMSGDRLAGTNAITGEKRSPGQGGPGGKQPPAKPLTAEQVGLVRAWIDQGAK